MGVVGTLAEAVADAVPLGEVRESVGVSARRIATQDAHPVAGVPGAGRAHERVEATAEAEDQVTALPQEARSGTEGQPIGDRTVGIASADPDEAAGRDRAEERTQQRRLSRARRAEQGNPLAGPDVDGEVAHRGGRIRRSQAVRGEWRAGGSPRNPAR
jgi:hypothetical protein